MEDIYTGYIGKDEYRKRLLSHISHTTNYSVINFH